MKDCIDNGTMAHFFPLPPEMFKEMLQPWKYKPEFKLTAFTYCIALLVGGLGNAAIGLSLIVISKRQSHASNNTSLFLASLTVADLLLLFVYVPLEMWRQIDANSVNAVVCKLTSYVEMLVALASVINLTAVSIERYIVIVHPMRSRALCTLTNCRKALLAVWLVSIILALPVIYTNDVYSVMYVEENEEDCLNQNNSIVVWKCTEDTSPDAPPIMGSFVATYQMCMIFLFPAMLMTTSYYRVMKTLWRSTQNMPFLTNTSQPTGTETLSCRALAGGKGSGPPATSQRGILKSSQSSSKHRTSHRPEPNQPYNCDGYEPTRANVSSISIQSKVLCSSAGNTEKINQSRKQIIKMLLVIILLFILCWCPRFLLNLVKWYSGLLPSRPDFFLGSPFYYFSTSAKILPVIHAMLNPIIYSLMCRSVRQMIFSCFSPSTQSNSRNVCSVIRRSEAWNDQSFELQEDAGERSQPSFHGTGTTFIRTSDQDLR